MSSTTASCSRVASGAAAPRAEPALDQVADGEPERDRATAWLEPGGQPLR